MSRNWCTCLFHLPSCYSSFFILFIAVGIISVRLLNGEHVTRRPRPGWWHKRKWRQIPGQSEWSPGFLSVAFCFVLKTQMSVCTCVLCWIIYIWEFCLYLLSTLLISVLYSSSAVFRGRPFSTKSIVKRWTRRHPDRALGSLTYLNYYFMKVYDWNFVEECETCGRWFMLGFGYIVVKENFTYFNCTLDFSNRQLNNDAIHIHSGVLSVTSEFCWKFWK